MAPHGAIFLIRFSPSIPDWRETRLHKTLVFRQRRYRLAVSVIELDVQCAEIGLLAFRARRLRDRGNAVLIEQPFQRDLRGAGIMLLADRHQGLIGGGPAL